MNPTAERVYTRLEGRWEIRPSEDVQSEALLPDGTIHWIFIPTHTNATNNYEGIMIMYRDGVEYNQTTYLYDSQSHQLTIDRTICNEGRYCSIVEDIYRVELIEAEAICYLYLE